jgi:predicted SprT family Zn-dependent metalloprotease
MAPIPRTVDFLDRLARHVAQSQGLPRPASDYRLAQILKLTTASISAWRTGKAYMGEDACIQVAELLGLDHQYVLACIQAERTQNAAAKKVWEKVARGAAMLLIALTLWTGAAPKSADATESDRVIHYAQRRRRWAAAGATIPALAGCATLTPCPMPADQEAAFKAVVAGKIEAFNTFHGSHYQVPAVIFTDLSGDYARSSFDCWCIAVDPRKALADWDDAINDTIPHELAHLVVDDFYGSRLVLVGTHYKRVGNVADHGPEWQAAMRAFGGDPCKHGYCGTGATKGVTP